MGPGAEADRRSTGGMVDSCVPANARHAQVAMFKAWTAARSWAAIRSADQADRAMAAKPAAHAHHPATSAYGVNTGGPPGPLAIGQPAQGRQTVPRPSTGGRTSPARHRPHGHERKPRRRMPCAATDGAAGANLSPHCSPRISSDPRPRLHGPDEGRGAAPTATAGIACGAAPAAMARMLGSLRVQNRNRCPCG